VNQQPSSPSPAAAVTVYFDYASPWSYVAEETASQKLEGIKLDWVPIYIRGLPAFSKGMPYAQGKLSYLARDLMRVVEHEGLSWAQPAAFPIDAIHALRAAIVAKEASESSFRKFHKKAMLATWADQVDIADKVVISSMLRDSLGGNASDELVSSFTSDRVKLRLRKNTEEAVARGVFGLPTFFVGDEMFWGHDRMDYVARAVRR